MKTTFHVGDIIFIEDKKYEILGRIRFKCKDSAQWDEYKIRPLASVFNDEWLSIDGNDVVYWTPGEFVDVNESKYTLVESNKEIVEEAYGDVDVYSKDNAQFWEYSTLSNEAYSIEKWDDDETEYFVGKRINSDKVTLALASKKTEKKRTKSGSSWIWLIALGVGFAGYVGYTKYQNHVDPISTILEKSQEFTQSTYITGKDKKYATVYEHDEERDADNITKYIIDQRKGKTTTIQQDPNNAGNIAIITDDEYCFIYTPTGEDVTYLQVSSREWALENLDEPLYKGDDKTQKFYQEVYERTAYSEDSTKNPSRARHHSRIHFIPFFGSSHYDNYSSSVREASRSRSTSGGSHGGGGK